MALHNAERLVGEVFEGVGDHDNAALRFDLACMAEKAIGSVHPLSSGNREKSFPEKFPAARLDFQAIAGENLIIELAEIGLRRKINRGWLQLLRCRFL
ncbi:hypothetical protein SDC9_99856 [bioreactor metagenome]|uniref:Uncharacterized protein n=1 Tax=bioreactor metagenome TaxID=1076179 RepID=A0A645AIN1_9ZZZZ